MKIPFLEIRIIISNNACHLFVRLRFVLRTFHKQIRATFLSSSPSSSPASQTSHVYRGGSARPNLCRSWAFLGLERMLMVIADRIKLHFNRNRHSFYSPCCYCCLSLWLSMVMLLELIQFARFPNHQFSRTEYFTFSLFTL